MEEKPSIYLPFYALNKNNLEKHGYKCVAFTERQIKNLSLSHTTTLHGGIKEQFNHKHEKIVTGTPYTYGAVIADGILQGCYLIEKGEETLIHA